MPPRSIPSFAGWSGRLRSPAWGLGGGAPGEAPAPEGGEEAIAIDGKTLRGSQKQGAPGAHLLSALAHRVGLTLAQQAVDDKTNEIPVALDLLRHLVLEGRIVTMDALLTQRQIAQHIVDAGGDYVMVVKENQPQLLEDIADRLCPGPPGGRVPYGGSNPGPRAWPHRAARAADQFRARGL